MRILGTSSDDEMVATFLCGELSSERFGADIRACLASLGRPEDLLTSADLSDVAANAVRRSVLATTRGYGEGRELFIDFPAQVDWVRAVLRPEEVAAVRYMDYSYWYEISGGSRLPSDAAARIRAGVQAWGVPNDRFTAAACALARGERFPPLILVGENLRELVCLEGHLRLTAYALAGFPVDVECLVGTSPTMGLWTKVDITTRRVGNGESPGMRLDSPRRSGDRQVAAQRMQVRTTGRASSRSLPISPPHSTHVP